MPRYMNLSDSAAYDEQDWLARTSRWTSSSYQIQFDTIALLTTEDDDDEDNFDLSAWGISQSLRDLLADYHDEDVLSATEWLASYQSLLVAQVLEEMAHSARRERSSIPPLHRLFITLEAELYLPHGLRMPVSCVTNIVPYETSGGSVDKFLAILDRGETLAYIEERSDNYQPPRPERLQ